MVRRPGERPRDGPAALARGYEYIAICDHTPAVGAVPGLTPDDVRRQGEEIAAANEVLAPFRVLRGIECDILPDGRLDLPDDVLAELDWVQASVHGGQRMPRREMTKRVEEALRNPYVSCLSHPKGRIINRRPENALDLERVYEIALEEGVALEVNGLPDRLDLRGEHVRDALKAGVEIVCSTDTHSVRGLENMLLSVMTARRGWATSAQVVNTRPLQAILGKASRRRSQPHAVHGQLRHVIRLRRRGGLVREVEHGDHHLHRVVRRLADRLHAPAVDEEVDPPGPPVGGVDVGLGHVDRQPLAANSSAIAGSRNGCTPMPTAAVGRRPARPRRRRPRTRRSRRSASARPRARPSTPRPSTAG